MTDKDFYEEYVETKPDAIASVELTYRELMADDEDLDQLFADGLEEMDTDLDVGRNGRKGTVASLKAFLENPLHIYLVGFADGNVAGRVFGYIHDHPRGNRTIFCDEVDTLKAYRRRGVAAGLLQEFKNIARNLDAEEFWLGTEPDNRAALALYRSLDPTEDDAEQLFAYNTEQK